MRRWSVPTRLPIVSFQIMPLARFAFGRRRVDTKIKLLFSVRQVLVFKLLEASQSVIVDGEEIEGLTAKVFRGDFHLELFVPCDALLGALLIQKVHF